MHDWQQKHYLQIHSADLLLCFSVVFFNFSSRSLSFLYQMKHFAQLSALKEQKYRRYCSGVNRGIPSEFLQLLWNLNIGILNRKSLVMLEH